MVVKVGLWSLKTIMVERRLLLAPCLGFLRGLEEQEGKGWSVVGDVFRLVAAYQHKVYAWGGRKV